MSGKQEFGRGNSSMTYRGGWLKTVVCIYTTSGWVAGWRQWGGTERGRNGWGERGREPGYQSARGLEQGRPHAAWLHGVRQATTGDHTWQRPQHAQQTACMRYGQRFSNRGMGSPWGTGVNTRSQQILRRKGAGCTCPGKQPPIPRALRAAAPGSSQAGACGAEYRAPHACRCCPSGSA